jgi:AH receptor-interacting protein
MYHREQPGSDEVKGLEAQKAPLLLNYALCLMRGGEFYEATQHLNTALAIQPRKSAQLFPLGAKVPGIRKNFTLPIACLCVENVKGLFRRGKCARAVGDFDEARADLKRVVELDASLRGAVGKELEEIAKEERRLEEKDKATFSKLFSQQQQQHQTSQ